MSYSINHTFPFVAQRDMITHHLSTLTLQEGKYLLQKFFPGSLEYSQLQNLLIKTAGIFQITLKGITYKINTISDSCKLPGGFKESKYTHIGEQIVIKGLDQDKSILILGDRKLEFSNIIALADGFYAIPSQMISLPAGTNEDQIAQLEKKFNGFIKKNLQNIESVLAKNGHEFSVVLASTTPYHRYSWSNFRKMIPLEELKENYAKIKEDYEEILIDNHNHFGKDAEDTYQTIHALALEVAKKAGQTQNKDELKRAYALDAYACHFLIDLFTAGHIRNQYDNLENFFRAELEFSIVMSKNIAGALINAQYEKDGKEGLKVENQRGDIWTSYGNESYFSTKNEENRRKMIEAVQLSVDEIYNAYTSPEDNLISDVLRLIPCPTKSNSFPLYTLKTNSLVFYKKDEEYPIEARTCSFKSIFYIILKCLPEAYFDDFILSMLPDSFWLSNLLLPQLRRSSKSFRNIRERVNYSQSKELQFVELEKSQRDQIIQSLKVEREKLQELIAKLQKKFENEKEFIRDSQLDIENYLDIENHQLNDKINEIADCIEGVYNNNDDILNKLVSKYIGIEERRINLQKLREKEPSRYPPYLDGILSREFFHLYDHLITMKNLSTQAARDAQEKKLLFSSFAQIILEFREATLTQVEEMIPEGSNNILFLLGDTGSGKSTTLCYLRGDEMKLNGTAYQSSMDKSHIIGDDTENSCTLFPNIEIDSNFIFVDFPGFNDTHGQVISLAVEISLRALVKKYSPGVLLLTSIIDTEARYAHAHLLGERLKRILKDLDPCILGITKYSKDPNFIAIKYIEKRQKEELSIHHPEKFKLKIEIENLLSLINKYPFLQFEIDQKNEELKKLEQVSNSSPSALILDTEEKRKYRQALQEKEEALKKHTGVKRILSFANLQDKQQLTEILDILKSQFNMVSASKSRTLDPVHKELLEVLFKNNLIQIIKSSNNYSSFNSENIEKFERSILETSLINTILLGSYPEIGRFFHLEEMDPDIIRKYDKEVITDCINDYIDMGISLLLNAQSYIKQDKVREEQKKEMHDEWLLLQRYILILSKGLPQEVDQGKSKAAWKSLQKEYKQRLAIKEQNPELPGWIACVLTIFLNKSDKTFIQLKDDLDPDIARDLEQKIGELYQSIQVTRQGIGRLKNIENTVKKRDRLDKAFAANPLSLDSIASLRQSITDQILHVKAAYGEKEWKEREKSFFDEFTPRFNLIETALTTQEKILYALISQEVSWEQLPPYFNEATFLTLMYTFINPQSNYQFVLRKLVPDWRVSQYKNLNLKNPDQFFQISLINKQDYQSLRTEGEKLLRQFNKNPILQLLFVDVIYKEWKKISNIHGKKKEELLKWDAKNNQIIKSDKIKIINEIKRNQWTLEYSKGWLRTSREFILAAVKVNGKALTFANDFLKNDREVVFTAVKQNGMAFQYASEILKNDLEIVLTAVQQDGEALKYTSQTFQNDREVVFTAVKQNGMAFQYASEILKNEKEIVLTAVQQNGEALKYTSQTFQNDREVVFTAVKQNGMAFQYASEILKNDLEIVLTAVKQNGMAFQYASEALKNDLEIVLTAVKQNGVAFQYASEALKNNREVVFAAVKQDGALLKYTNETLKNDREIVLTAVKQNRMAFQYASEILKNDREFILAAVQQGDVLLKYTNKILKNDREIVLAAIQQDGTALEYASERLKNEWEIVLTAIQQDGTALEYASEILKNDREIVLAAIQQEGTALEYASETLQNDREIVLTAIQQEGTALEYASETLKNDREIVLAAIQQDKVMPEYLNEMFNKDQKNLILNINPNNGLFNHDIKRLQNKSKLILEILRRNKTILEYASETLQNDREIVLAAVKQKGIALQYASETLKNDREIVLAAVKQNDKALKYASETLKNDREIILAAVKQKRVALQ